MYCFKWDSKQMAWTKKIKWYNQFATYIFMWLNVTDWYKQIFLGFSIYTFYSKLALIFLFLMNTDLNTLNLFLKELLITFEILIPSLFLKPLKLYIHCNNFTFVIWFDDLILFGLVRCVLHSIWHTKKSYIKVTSWRVINCFAIYTKSWKFGLLSLCISLSLSYRVNKMHQMTIFIIINLTQGAFLQNLILS